MVFSQASNTTQPEAQRKSSTVHCLQHTSRIPILSNFSEPTPHFPRAAGRSGAKVGGGGELYFVEVFDHLFCRQLLTFFFTL